MRYFFHVTDGHVTDRDDEGSELPDQDAAYREAVEGIQTLLAEGDRKGCCRRHWRMDVVDEEGKPVFSLTFSHTLRSDRLDSLEAPGATAAI